MFESFKAFSPLLESIYRGGARRWRRLYCVNGHLFQTKRFTRVSLRRFLPQQEPQ